MVCIEFLVVFSWNVQGCKPRLGSLAAVEAEFERHWKLAQWRLRPLSLPFGSMGIEDKSGILIGCAYHLDFACSFQIARAKYQNLMVKAMYDKNMDNGMSHPCSSFCPSELGRGER